MIDVKPATPQEDAAIREVQAHESPEGAPPPLSTRRKSWTIFAVCVIALTIVTVAALLLIDGGTALAVGLAMLLGYAVIGGAVAIVAVSQRTAERAEIKQEVDQG